MFDLPADCAALSDALFLFAGIVIVIAVTYAMWYLLNPREEED